MVDRTTGIQTAIAEFMATPAYKAGETLVISLSGITALHIAQKLRDIWRKKDAEFLDAKLDPPEWPQIRAVKEGNLLEISYPRRGRIIEFKIKEIKRGK
jgi:hypothetical protein